jgi:hypothetical protein
MHLMITKAAKLSWRNLHDDKFELDISSSSNSSNLPESAVPRIEAVGSVGLESVSSSQPLAAYGIKKGGMLELVPCEPEVDCDALPDGSPSLTSPAHQLHRHWQAAREGLAEGIAPQLVAAGTGGSYFLQDAAGSTVAVFKPCDEEPNAGERTGLQASCWKWLRQSLVVVDGALDAHAVTCQWHAVPCAGLPPAKTSTN